MKILLCLLIVCSLVVPYFSTAQAQSTTIITSNPKQVDLGSSFTVYINISDVASLNAANYDILFDPKILEVSSVDNGLIKDTLIPVDAWRVVSPGVLRVVNFMGGLGGITGEASGSGYLSKVAFNTLSIGESKLELTNGVLSNTGATEIEAKWESSVVIVTYPIEVIGNSSAVEIRQPSTGISTTIVTSSKEKVTSEISFSEWDGEAQFSLSLPFGTFDYLDISGTGASSDIKLQNTDYDISVKPTAVKKGFNEFGGVDLNITLFKAPDKPKFVFELSKDSGVTAYVQPSLSKEWKVGDALKGKARVASVSDTEVIGDDGATHMSRPAYVVNSIAFFYEQSGDYSLVGGQNYRTGLIGYLYRPLLIDSGGHSAYADWSMSDDATVVLTDTTGFLFDKDTVYPVTISPAGDTFGYTSIGASTDYSCNYPQVNKSFTLPTYNGLLTSISLYTYSDQSAKLCPALYSDSAGSPSTRLAYLDTDGTIITATPGWVTTNLSYSTIVAGTQYWIGEKSGTNGICYYSHYTSTAGVLIYYADAAGNWPSSWSGANTLTYRYSIYATYTRNLTITTTAATSVGNVSAVLNGNITAGTATYYGWGWGKVSRGALGNVSPAASGYTYSCTSAIGSYGVGAYNSSGNATGLSPHTLYYYNFAVYDGAWVWDSETTFATIVSGYFALTNNSSFPVDIKAKATNMTGGVTYTLVSGVPGADQFRLTVFTAGETIYGGLILTTLDQSWLSDMPVGNTTYWDLKFDTWSSNSDGATKTSIITLTAEAS